MIYVLLAVTTYILMNLGSDQLPKILEMVSTVAFYYSLYFLGFILLSTIFLSYKLIKGTKSVSLSHPKELEMEEFWKSLIKGNLTYSHSIWFLKRQIVPYSLNKVYSNIFEKNIELERKYVEKFLLNQDYSSAEFRELYGKLRDYFTPDNGITTSMIELNLIDYVEKHKNRIIAIKRNEEFNTFLEKNK